MPGDEKKLELTQDEFDAKVAEAVKAANKALEHNRDEVLAEAKETKAALKDAKAKLAEQEQAAIAASKNISGEELKKLREQVRLDLDKEYEPFKQSAESLAKENRSLKLDNVVKAKMLSVGVRGDRVDALFKLTADRYDLLDDGTPYLKAEKGADLGKFLGEKLKTEYPELYNGSGSSGGGASKSTHSASGGAQRVIAVSDLAKYAKEVAAGTVTVDYDPAH